MSNSKAAVEVRSASIWLALSLLIAGLFLAVSLVSHSEDPESNWLGLVGHLLAITLRFLLGVGSYFLSLLLIGLSVRAFRDALPKYWKWGLCLSVLSFSLLFTVIGDCFPAIGVSLRGIGYSSIVTHVRPLAFREVQIYLGGAILGTFYEGIPLCNLRELLSPIGTLAIAGIGLLTGVLILVQRGPLILIRRLFGMIRQLKLPIRKKERPVSPLVELAPLAPPPVPVEIPRVVVVGETKKMEAPTRKPKVLERGPKTTGGYRLPALNLLTQAKKVDQSALLKGLRTQAEILEETLGSFGIEAKVGDIHCGPTIISFEVHPAVGVKVQRIQALEKDLALNLKARAIRLIAPIPGKAAVGVEIPNPRPQEVGLREMLESMHSKTASFRIPLILGKAVNGDELFADLAKMPHLLIAGATGSGKSVYLNTLIMTILMTASPDEVRLIMVDPKKVELSAYSELPHMAAPVITEPKEACIALHWLVKEMERRYELLRLLGVRNIDSFNERQRDLKLEESLEIEVPERLSYIVAIIDELADLMMVSSSDIETPIARIAQMARAVGIHLVLATQRPSREVLTGLIKANFPTRLAFKVSSRVNSQIILDEPGAESLIGNGDVLFCPPGTHHLTRAQAPYVRDVDIHAVCEFIKQQRHTEYLISSFCDHDDLLKSDSGRSGEGQDALYSQARDLVVSTGLASTTYLQRKLKIGYARAASLMDELEESGIVAPAEGSKARRLLIGRRSGKEE